MTAPAHHDVWYVASTRPRQEARAAENLARQGYRAWLPRYQRTRRHARRFDSILAPLFPGYIFVGLASETQPFAPISGTFGIRNLVRHGGRPALLPLDFALSLRARSDASGLVHAASESLAPGMSVRVVSGPFADCVARLTSLEDGGRVSLLLRVLGGDVTALLPVGAIAPVA